MYTPTVVYHAPQMKNWRNIIVDSLVRITRQDAATASSFVNRMMICAPAGKTMSESLDDAATPAPAMPPITPPTIVPFLFPPSTRPRMAPAAAPTPTFAASPLVMPRPLWIVSSESTDASIGYEVPRTVMLATLNVKVPGVLGLG